MSNFTKLWEYFFVHKEKKTNLFKDLFPPCHPGAILESITYVTDTLFTFFYALIWTARVMQRRRIVQ